METCTNTTALLPERWVLGQLDPAAAAELEEHLLICGACQEAVESASGLRRGLALVAAERAARPLPAARPAARWLALAALVPLALGVLLYRQQGAASALRVEVARLEAASAKAELLEEEVARARLAGADEQQRRKLAEERGRELELQLQQKSPAATVPATTAPAATAGALVNLPTFLLAAVRDRPAGPDLVLDRGKLGKAFNLALDLPDPSYTQFRIELESGGKKLLSRGGIASSALEVLLLTLPADFLPPGESRITLFGEGPGRPEQELARFRIAVRP